MVNPANVKLDDPKLIAVVPTVIALLVNRAFGKDPLVILLALVVSVVADAASPLILLTAIAALELMSALTILADKFNLL